MSRRGTAHHRGPTGRWSGRKPAASARGERRNSDFSLVLHGFIRSQTVNSGRESTSCRWGSDVCAPIRVTEIDAALQAKATTSGRLRPSASATTKAPSCSSGGGQVGGSSYGTGGGTNSVETKSVEGGSGPAPAPPSRNYQRCRELADNERDAKRKRSKVQVSF